MAGVGADQVGGRGAKGAGKGSADVAASSLTVKKTYLLGALLGTHAGRIAWLSAIR